MLKSSTLFKWGAVVVLLIIAYFMLAPKSSTASTVSPYTGGGNGLGAWWLVVKNRGIFKIGLIGVFLIIAFGVIGRLLIYFLYPTLTVTSWWRTPWHNAEIGGIWNSLHQIGLAYDVVPNTQDTVDKLTKLFPWVYFESDHVHAGWSWIHEGVTIQ